MLQWLIMKDLQLPVQIFNSHLGLAVVAAIFHLAVTYPRYWYMNQRSVDGKIWRRRGFVLTTELWSAMTLIWLVIRKFIVLHSISHFCSMMKLLEPYHLLAIPSHCLLRYTNHSKVVLSHRLLWFCRVIMWKDVVLWSWLILTIGHTSSSHPVHMTLKGN